MHTEHAYALPECRNLFYGGRFHVPQGGYGRTLNPATQEDLGPVSNANAADVDAAVQAAHLAFQSWRHTKPAVRAAALREFGNRLRTHAEELGFLDAINCGNPVREMAADVHFAAMQVDYFAGLVHEAKGDTLPMGDGVLNYSVREPYGVVARIVAYNHPLMFLAAKLAAAVAAGNTVILKAATQAPLSAYRLATLLQDVFPPGVVNVLSGDTPCGQALVDHPLVKKVSLIGSTATGKSILRSAAEKVMPVSLELGGKNPLIICPEADMDKAIEGAVKGMNFTWAGQSCGSTSRCFVHRSVYDRVIKEMVQKISQLYRCGLPTDPATTMGCLVSKAQYEKVMSFIDSAHKEGARLVCGGVRPSDKALDNGWFVTATVFADVTPAMRLFREEVFGPVLAVIPWDEEEDLLRMVNGLDFGLTASIWTKDLARAHRLASRVESGYVWINHVSAHFIGADFGGYKQSGLGREEGVSELLAWTQTKNVHVVL
ncbi:aldehyde dehydrogenase family protein [Acidovorax sp. JG5]|uniref:aldehyde dehydrogenase family protein n=1 Tax=Acidovorax sp. JG5 TaxID=2822718 RepID=UPI001B33ABDF|nr:aldehyde dehydrogenase family protein [Acidovorax sp. JG5]MBP3982470.1 aldehyde dehydrogenase family protein [Acidovorax sp. JG5]